VSRGTRVVWAFKGRVSHNVAVRRGPVKFRSRTMARGNFAETLRRAGTYKIICTIHPGMEMTLRVR
jgi:plastocyanin